MAKTTGATQFGFYAVDPTKADQVAELVRQGIDKFARSADGFVSSRIYKSADGAMVISETQWTDASKVAASIPEEAPDDYNSHAAELEKLASRHEAHLCVAVGEVQSRA